MGWFPYGQGKPQVWNGETGSPAGHHAGEGNRLGFRALDGGCRAFGVVHAHARDLPKDVKECPDRRGVMLVWVTEEHNVIRIQGDARCRVPCSEASKMAMLYGSLEDGVEDVNHQDKQHGGDGISLANWCQNVLKSLYKKEFRYVC